MLSLTERSGIEGYDLSCFQHLSRLQIPSRYPDAFPEGPAEDYSSNKDKQKAIARSTKVIEWMKEIGGRLRGTEKA